MAEPRPFQAESQRKSRDEMEPLGNQNQRTLKSTSNVTQQEGSTKFNFWKTFITNKSGFYRSPR